MRIRKEHLLYDILYRNKKSKMQLWKGLIFNKGMSVFFFWGGGVYGEWIGAWDKQSVWTVKRFSGDLFVPHELGKVIWFKSIPTFIFMKPLNKIFNRDG